MAFRGYEKSWMKARKYYQSQTSEKLMVSYSSL